MSKLYFVKYEVIAQAERMKDKYYFLAENEQWKVQENTMSNKDAERHFKKSEMYHSQAEKINEALMSIVGNNQATWNNIQILKQAAFQRTMLDNEIEASRQ